MHENAEFILVRALTTDPPQVGPSDVPHLLAAGLAGQVRMRLPTDHPLQDLLRPSQLNQGNRHAYIRAELRPLLVAWARGGIPALLFKGFSLSEFEYVTSGERFYGDVDVLIPEDPAIVARAVHIALAHGWRSDGHHAVADRWTHESAHLFSPGGHVRLDVHRFCLGWVVGSQARVRRVTQAVWSGAQALDWAGIPVWIPHPRDALVLILALARQWGGEAGSFKPADYADAALLMSRYVFKREQLAERAGEVGAEHTWAAFQACCDPERQRFMLGNAAASAALRAAVRRDGLSQQQNIWHRRLKVLPSRLLWVPALLPDAFAAWRAVRAGGDPRTYLARWTPPVPPYGLRLSKVQDVISAARLLTRLLYPQQVKTGTCVPLAYTIYRALRRLGHPAVFVSGVTVTPTGIQGHAWVEDIRGPLDDYGEPLNRLHFKEVFHFPDENTPSLS